jgi:DNA-binding MarR family transcriptional regulator
MISLDNDRSAERQKVHAPAVGISFLLSQIGAHAAFAFGEMLLPMGLTPYHAGILRMLAVNPGLSQQGLSELFGVFPSRLVQLLDELQNQGLIDRQPSSSDRRIFRVQLTVAGRLRLAEVQRVTRKLDHQIAASLSEFESSQLIDLLTRIVSEQGITPAVHPAYRKRAAEAKAGRSKTAQPRGAARSREGTDRPTARRAAGSTGEKAGGKGSNKSL